MTFHDRSFTRMLGTESSVCSHKSQDYLAHRYRFDVASASATLSGNLISLLVARSFGSGRNAETQVIFPNSKNLALINLLESWNKEDSDVAAIDLEEQFVELNASRMRLNQP